MEKEKLEDRGTWKRKPGKKKLLEELVKHPMISLACKNAGVSRTTYYRWRKEDVEFRQKAEDTLDESVEALNDLVASTFLNLIRNGNIAACIFWLKTRHPDFGGIARRKGHGKTEEEAFTPEMEESLAAALGALKGGPCEKCEHTIRDQAPRQSPPSATMT